MRRIEIFEGPEDAGVIFNALKDDGLVGICGGRLEVREKLKRVSALIENEALKGYYASSSINHPMTELGYAFNEALYSIEQARSYVTEAYEKKYADQIKQFAL